MNVLIRGIPLLILLCVASGCSTHSKATIYHQKLDEQRLVADCNARFNRILRQPSLFPNIKQYQEDAERIPQCFRQLSVARNQGKLVSTVKARVRALQDLSVGEIELALVSPPFMSYEETIVRLQRALAEQSQKLAQLHKGQKLVQNELGLYDRLPSTGGGYFLAPKGGL